MNEKFFIVPTPIGNLQDITLRAVEILKSVDFIACEDTRVTQKLLNHFNIDTKTFAYHKFNEKVSVEKILNLLEQGKTIALVSDAGTPLISDPGSILIEQLRKNNIQITSLPGACALTTFLSQIPKGDEEFTFIGFMPKKESQIEDILNSQKNNIIFYESPNRLLQTLKTIKNFNDKIEMAVGRELTKVFEEVLVMSVSELIDYYSENVLKGEIVGVIYKPENITDENIPVDKVLKLMKLHYSTRDIAQIIHALYGINKNKIFEFVNKNS